MKKITTTLLICLFTLTSKSQEVRVIEEYIKQQSIKLETFELLNEVTSLKDCKLIARLEGKAKKAEKETIDDLFYKFRGIAHKMGGNSYRIDSIIEKKALFTIYISVYFTSEKDLRLNQEAFQTNNLIILGYSDKLLGFARGKINSYRIKIPPFHFINVSMTPDEIIVLNSGGITGTYMRITGKIKAPSKYIQFTRAITSSSPSLGPQGGINTSVVTGTIKELEYSLGRFLERILTKMDEPYVR